MNFTQPYNIQMQKAGFLDLVHRHQLLPASDLER
jgi:hypothetical protein